MSKRKLSPKEEEAIATAIQSGKSAKDLAPLYSVSRQTIGNAVRRVTGKTIWELRQNIAAEADEGSSNLDPTTRYQMALEIKDKQIAWHQKHLEAQNKKIAWYLTTIEYLLKLLEKKSSSAAEEGDISQSKPSPPKQA